MGAEIMATASWALHTAPRSISHAISLEKSLQNNWIKHKMKSE